MIVSSALSMQVLVASIPAPPSNVLQLGPLSFHLYGLCIAIGAVAGISLARKRWADSGGDPDDITTVALIAVPAGLVGARIYHVITDFQLYDNGRWWPDAFMVWKGGLGIPGGVIGGVIGALIVARYKKMPWRVMGDAAAPALPLAQAIGRFGNYFNQELFGRETTLPWGLEVDMDVTGRPPIASPDALFHPTFLYEALWNLALVALIVVGTKRIALKPGRWFAVYVMGYGLGRLWVESLRIDDANTILGLRVNTWTSGLAIIGGLVWLLWGGGPKADVSTADGAIDGGVIDGGVIGDRSASGDRGADPVGEAGPSVDRPAVEGTSGDDHTADTDAGVRPEERSGGTEVPEDA